MSASVRPVAFPGQTAYQSHHRPTLASHSRQGTALIHFGLALSVPSRLKTPPAVLAVRFQLKQALFLDTVDMVRNAIVLDLG